MAEETSEKKVEKKGSKKGIFIGVAILLVLGAAGAGAATFYMGKGSKDPAGSKKDDEKARTSWTLGDFVVNLQPVDAEVFLKIDLALGYTTKVGDSNLLDTELNTRRDELMDIVTMILSSKSREDLGDTRGKEQLKQEMMRSINEVLAEGQIEAIYFRKFTISEP